MPDDEVVGLQFGAADKPTLETLRQDADHLRDVLPAEDLTRHAAFTPGKVDLGDAARLTPELGEGLRIGGAWDELDAGLGELGALAANARVRRLLGQAREKIDGGEHQAAIALLDQALELDPGAAVAVGLQAVCACALGEGERALDLLDRARDLAADAETGLLVSTMRADCEQQITDAVGEEVGALLDEDAVGPALDVLGRYVRRLPTSLPLRYLHAGALMMSGQVAEALLTLDAALRTATGENAEIFRAMRARARVAQHGAQVDGARERLRADDPKGAIRHLEQCPADVREVADVALLWDYAHERRAGRALLPFVGRKRMTQAGAAPVEPDALEDLLAWLFAEELRAGREAIEQERFRDACDLYAAAERVDDRCRAVAYWHAIALVLLCRSPQTALPECEDLLLAAQARTGLAAEEPQRRESVEEIAALIERDLAQVRLLTRVGDLITRFNTEAQALTRRGIQDYYELDRTRARFQNIRSHAISVHRLCEKGSPSARQMEDLIKAVDNIFS